MRVLVIGGTRFIGPRVIHRLIEAGHTVAVFYRGEHEAPLPPTVTRLRDARAAIPVRQIPPQLRDYEPEIVLHMIAMGERDAVVAREAFVNVARRIVVASSGDVYRAYGVFKGIETGHLEPTPLQENAALRTQLFPYRTASSTPDALEYFYEKILVESAIGSDPRLPATILRLPKVYGPGGTQQLATVYGFRHHPQWRWTHGHVDNVAAAIALALLDERATGRTYNVGEALTPTVAERLAYLPSLPVAPLISEAANFAQDISYDTGLIRRELGYREAIDEHEAMIAVASDRQGCDA